MLRAAMQKAYCSVYKTSSEDTTGLLPDSDSEELTESVNLVFTDPPYNTRSGQNHDSSAHDVISDNEINRVTEVVQERFASG